MTRRRWMLVAATLALVLGQGSVTDRAHGQQGLTMKDLVGAWKLVSVTNTRPDGTVSFPLGKQAKGILIFDAAGNFSWQAIDPGIPRFASNNRHDGTPEEHRAVVHGVMSYFGAYSVDASGKGLTLDIVSSSWPHFTGAKHQRAILMSGDELSITNPAGSTGGGVTEARWKRMN